MKDMLRYPNERNDPGGGRLILREGEEGEGREIQRRNIG